MVLPQTQKADEHFANFAANHHKPSSPYEHIVKEADHISAGLDRREPE